MCSQCHLCYSTVRGQLYTLYTSPELYFSSQHLLQQRWEESFTLSLHWIKETAYLDRENCHKSHKWSTEFHTVALIVGYTK